MKLTPAQLSNLRRLGKDGDLFMHIWGSGFGLRRPTVATLAKLGLATYDPSRTDGIASGITQTGLDYLRSLDATPPKIGAPTALDRQVLAALASCHAETASDATACMVADKAGFRGNGREEKAARHLLKLKELGLVQRTRAGTAVCWKLTPDGTKAADALADTTNA